MRTTNRLNEFFLVAVATVSLATISVACGTYTSAGGTGGSNSASGGASGGAAGSASGGAAGSASGGAAGSASGGAAGSASGGTTVAPSGGAAGNASGGSTVTPSGGAAGNASGGSTVKPTGGSGGNGTGGASAGGSTGSGGSTKADAAAAGGATGTGGSTAKADAATTGGATGTGGSSSAGTGGSTGAGGSTAVTLPCDVFNSATSNKCVSAHSTVRLIVSGYTGPLYQLCKGTANTGPASCKGTPQDIGSKDGYADVTAHDAFCPSGTACTITKIYDQSGQKNDLEPAPQGGVCGPDKPADAKALPVTINGHSAYGVLIKAGIGYRAGCAGCTVKAGAGTVKGDDPESMYWVTSQKDLIDGCCFDYGNAETSSRDDGNGTMETLYFGGGVVWGTGAGGKPGPWIMADLENGLYAGWENKQDKNISTNTALKYDFVTGVLLGDTKDKNAGKGRFALYGGDAKSGTLKTMYDGIRPEKPGYVPMTKQGSIVLGIGGDNSCSAGGRFYEGAISTGPVISKEAVDALQAAIVAAKYQQ